MPRTRRRLIALLAVPLLVLMSGCMRMKADYEIIDEDQVRIAMDIGMRNDAIQELGEDVPDFCEQNDSPGTDDLAQEEYVDEGDDGYTGCRVTGTAPIDEVNDGSTKMVLEDGVWTFSMEGEEGGEAEGMSADMFSDFEVRVTFPGEVLTHNGASTREGNTVIWADPADLFTAEGLEATGKNGNAVPWLWIAVGALVAAALVAAVLLLRRRRGQSPPQTGGPWQGADGQQFPGQHVQWQTQQGPGTPYFPHGNHGQPHPTQGPGQQYPPQGPGQHNPSQDPGQQYPPQSNPGQDQRGPNQWNEPR